MVTFIKVVNAIQVWPIFLISDIWALWHSGLSAKVPKCQKLKMQVRPGIGPGWQSVTFDSCDLQRVNKRYYSYRWQNSAPPPTVISFNLITDKLNFIEISPSLNSIFFSQAVHWLPMLHIHSYAWGLRLFHNIGLC